MVLSVRRLDPGDSALGSLDLESTHIEKALLNLFYDGFVFPTEDPLQSLSEVMPSPAVSPKPSAVVSVECATTVYRSLADVSPGSLPWDVHAANTHTDTSSCQTSPLMASISPSAVQPVSKPADSDFCRTLVFIAGQFCNRGLPVSMYGFAAAKHLRLLYPNGPECHRRVRHLRRAASRHHLRGAARIACLHDAARPSRDGIGASPASRHPDGLFSPGIWSFGTIVCAATSHRRFVAWCGRDTHTYIRRKTHK